MVWFPVVDAVEARRKRLWTAVDANGRAEWPRRRV
jgi:hypothetical protein